MRLSQLFLAAVLLLSSACARGGPEGASCANALQCSTGFCLRPTSADGVCVRSCASSSDCTFGGICGRFATRPFDPDTGLGDTGLEVARVCRSPLNPPCANGACGNGLGCVGSPGVCAPLCRSNGECASGRCIADNPGTCDAAGKCAPQCDENAECPGTDWFCQFTGTSVHGTCVALGAPPVDAAVCSEAGPEASVPPDVATPDAATDVAMSDVVAPDAVAD